jgi:hypothetical protein
MDDQYPKLVVDSRLARRQLAQEFESRAASETKRRFSPVNDRCLATTPQKKAREVKTSYGGLVSSTMSSVHLRRSRKTGKSPDTAERDISGFGLVLTLMLLCEIAAAESDHPVFWLLVGPTPLALAVIATRLLAKRAK